SSRPHTAARTTAVTAVSSQRRGACSSIVPPGAAHGDAQRVEEHAGGVPGEAYRTVFVVYHPERLVARAIPGLAGPQQELDVEGEAVGLETRVERLRHRPPVALVAALRVVEVEAAQALHHEIEDEGREATQRPHVNLELRLRQGAIADHEVGPAPQ